MHTMTSHAKDKSKYLSYQQRNAIHLAASARPEAKPSQVRRNLKNRLPSTDASAGDLNPVSYALQARDTRAVNA